MLHPVAVVRVGAISRIHDSWARRVLDPSSWHAIKGCMRDLLCGIIRDDFKSRSVPSSRVIPTYQQTPAVKTRYGRKAMDGVLSGRDPGVLPGCQ